MVHSPKGCDCETPAGWLRQCQPVAGLASSGRPGPRAPSQHPMAAMALTARVAAASGPTRTAYICTTVFFSWFAAYGLRKPWGAGLYDGDPCLGLPEKDAIALSQTIG